MPHLLAVKTVSKAMSIQSQCVCNYVCVCVSKYALLYFRPNQNNASQYLSDSSREYQANRREVSLNICFLSYLAECVTNILIICICGFGNQSVLLACTIRSILMCLYSILVPICYIINTEEMKLIGLDNGWCSALKSICIHDGKKSESIEMQFAQNPSRTLPSVDETNSTISHISNASLGEFKAFCRLQLLKANPTIFKIKDRSRVELLVKIEHILSQKRWDLSDDLLMPLLNKFIRVYNCQDANQTPSRLQSGMNTELEIISLQSDAEQNAIDRESLLQEMVRCVNCEEAYFSLLNKLFHLEREIVQELY